MSEIFRRERAPVPLAFNGERFTSAKSGQIEIEHVHRYLLAREFCRGKDVLDVASGEGYGSALLSQVARSVVGVDLDEGSITHAKVSYARPNLRFCVGDARQIPLAEKSVDIVVSFETLEHLAEHDIFLDEIQRVLRPGGALIISSPERDVYCPPGRDPNPFHVRELSNEELESVLARRFKHVGLYGQRMLLGSAIVPLRSKNPGGVPTTFERRGDAELEGSIGLPRAMYVVAVASDERIAPLLASSLFVETSEVDDLLTARREETRSTDKANPAEKAWQAEAGRLLAELRQVRASRSWWITAPARKFWRTLRRLGR